MSCASETLRLALAGDAARLSAIDALVSLRPLSEAHFRRLCESSAVNTGLALVAEIDGQVCGFVVYHQVLDEGSINNIAVDPACQGRGYGRQLLCHTLAVMRDTGAARCLLEVRASNQAALSLYRSEGFRLDGKRAGYYSAGQGEREDALLMSKQL